MSKYVYLAGLVGFVAAVVTLLNTGDYLVMVASLALLGFTSPLAGAFVAYVVKGVELRGRAYRLLAAIGLYASTIALALYVFDVTDMWWAVAVVGNAVVAAIPPVYALIFEE